MNICMQGRCSFTSCRMSGLIFVVFRMTSCVIKALIISRTAVGQPMCNSSMQSTTHLSSKIMHPVVGELQQVKAPVPITLKSTESIVSFSTMWHEAYPMDQTMV